ncbi:hypothetical protein O7631_14115 [Micromonospora sp. WMMD967]|uniref:hypothetical protein n=1 Tax=Micromonospora sp. WMMD967 TaxID=3016101 RepID=UPI002416254A|nr:hypothetical protein [Micromonospora sp. WMMD967]MDG4837651.1 hypothetical protein [Micromonospora sp. WMMD967]
MQQVDDAEAGQWMTRHGLADVEPTPLLSARLAARRRAKLVDSILLAGFLVGAALMHALRLTSAASLWLPLLALTVLVVGMVLAQWRLGWWVRRADQRAGEHLSRRVALPVELGWSAVLGWPYAVFATAALTSAVLLAVSVLRVPDSGLRYGAVVVLIGLAGSGVSTVMQLRQVLASPAVAEDEASLTADVIMRVEDVRALVTPSLVWLLPAIFLYGESLGWWNVVSIVLVVAGVGALGVIHARTVNAETAARRAMAIR